MRVVCGHAANQERDHPGLFRETVAALDEFCPAHVEYYDVSAHEKAYFNLLSRVWVECARGGVDLVLVEHDVVVHEGVFPEFFECDEPWCAFPYTMGSVIQPGLGCTRFRKEMLAEMIGVWGSVARHGNDAQVGDGMPSKHWLRCDVRLDAELMPLGYLPHVHEPPVDHLNRKQMLASDPRRHEPVVLSQP